MKAIAKLPNEVLELILHHISTFDLLHYREVSAQWNQITTYVCRKRHVTITANKLYYRIPNPKFICQISPDKDNTPWSSIHIKHSTDHRSEAINRQLFGIFGRNITQLKITINTYDYQNFIYTLRNTPNLQVLQIISTFNSFIQPSQLIYAISHEGTENVREKTMCETNLPSGGVVSLLRLKYLEFSMNNPDSDSLHLDLLKFILCSCSAAIKSVSLGLEYISNEELFGQILVLLENIENVKLSLRYFKNFDIWNLLATSLLERPLNLQILSLKVYQSSRNPAPGYYEPLVNCLTNCEKLVKFKITINTVPTSSKPSFCLPILPTLEFLELYVAMSGGSTIQESVGDINQGIAPLNVVTPDQVPNLKILKISYNNKLLKHGVRFNQVFEEKRFESVSQLQGNVAIITENWSSRFPNLVNLSLIVPDSKSLEHVFECMKNVKYVYLNLNIKMDINATLKICFAKQPEIKELKTLEINEYGTDEAQDSKRLSDDGASLLLLLPPLHLKIKANNLSGECISKLKDHHKFVEQIKSGYMKQEQ